MYKQLYYIIVMLCPICYTEFTHLLSDRHPRIICSICTNTEILDRNNYKVCYSNESIHGGFISYHTTINGIIEQKDHICYIKGIECFADEGRYGGIIFQTIK